MTTNIMDLECSSSNDYDATSSSNSITYKSADLVQRALLILNNLRQSDLLCDVTLIVNGVKIQAHRVWLASCSPYFQAMFTNQMAESRQQEIQMIDIDEQTLQTLIDYCYSGTITISEHNVQQILPSACLLQLQEVQDFCCEFLKKQLDSSNCLGIRSFADTHSCRDLFRSSDKFMKSNMEEILQSEEFLQLPVNLLCEILSHDELDVNEEHAYSAALRWIKFDMENRKADLPKILEHIRLSQCSKQFIVLTVSQDPLIKENVQARDLVDEAKNFLLLPSTQSNERFRPRVPARFGILMFAVGGWCSGDALAETECMDSRNGQWRSVKSMSKRRCGVGVACLDKQIWALGGHDGSRYLKCVERYDPLRNQWSSDVKPTSTSRTSVGVAVLDSSLYAIGGQDGVSCLDVVEKYDPNANQWIKVAPMNSRRLGVSCSVLNGSLYACGGADGQSPLDSVEMYDPRMDAWINVTPMKTRRKHLGSAVLKNCLYAVGGRALDCELASAEKYEPRMAAWIPVVSLNSRRSGVGLAVVNDQIYAVGGFDGCSYLKSVEILEETPTGHGLDLTTSSPHWRSAGNMKYRRLGGGVAALAMSNEEMIACQNATSTPDAARSCFVDF